MATLWETEPADPASVTDTSAPASPEAATASAENVSGVRTTPVGGAASSVCLDSTTAERLTPAQVTHLRSGSTEGAGTTSGLP